MGALIKNGINYSGLSIDMIYPVGSIYISVNNTNPGTYLTGTTWVAWGAGRVPVGVDTTQTEFNTVEETGGAKSVTLTAAQSGIRAHGHTLSATSLNMFKSKINNVSYGLSNGGGFAGDVIVAQNTGNTSSYMLSSGSVPNNTAASATESHTNLQPYITCYMWKRVS
jgi:microcystin-dependent protein